MPGFIVQMSQSGYFAGFSGSQPIKYSTTEEVTEAARRAAAEANQYGDEGITFYAVCDEDHSIGAFSNFFSTMSEMKSTDSEGSQQRIETIAYPGDAVSATIAHASTAAPVGCSGLLHIDEDTTTRTTVTNFDNYPYLFPSKCVSSTKLGLKKVMTVGTAWEKHWGSRNLTWSKEDWNRLCVHPDPVTGKILQNVASDYLRPDSRMPQKDADAFYERVRDVGVPGDLIVPRPLDFHWNVDAEALFKPFMTTGELVKDEVALHELVDSHKYYQGTDSCYLVSSSKPLIPGFLTRLQNEVNSQRMPSQAVRLWPRPGPQSDDAWHGAKLLVQRYNDSHLA